MKLLLVTRKVDTQDDRAGFFVDWLNTFAQNLETLYVICLEKGDTSTLAPNITVASMGKEKGFSRFRKYLNYRKYLKQFLPGVDGVFIHMMPRYVNLGGRLIKKHDKKLVFWYTHKSVDQALKRTQKYVDQYVTASKLSFRMKTDIPVAVMGHGINLQAFAQNSKEKEEGVLRVLTVGRISQSKNIEILLEAINLLNKENSIDVICYIIGAPATEEDRNYEITLKKYVSDNGLEKVVNFVGAMSHSQLLPYYADADVCVNISSTGSLDKAVLEAMASKTLILTSNEAFVDILGDLAKKLMFTHKDSKELSKKLHFVYELSDKETYALQGELYEIVKSRHNLDVLIKNIVLLFTHE